MVGAVRGQNSKINLNPLRAPTKNIESCPSWTMPGAIRAGAIRASALSGLPQ